MGKLAEVFVDIGTKDRDLDSGLGRAKSKINAFSSLAQKSLNGMAAGFGAGIGARIENLASDGLGWLRHSIIAAGDLNESLSKTEVTFGAASRKITGFAENMAAKFGSAKGEILDAASGFGLIFKGANMAEDASADLAIKLATAADDGASLFNSDLPEALEKIRAGLVGESEPLRAYGVMLNEAAVQQEAMRLGLAKNKNELTESAKIMARASLIEKGLAVAKGDHAKTQGGLNNQLKEFGDRMTNFGTSVGSNFTPRIAGALVLVNKLVDGMNQLSGSAELGSALAAGSDAVRSLTKPADPASKGIAGAIAGMVGSAGDDSSAPSTRMSEARKKVMEDEAKEELDRLEETERKKRALEKREEWRAKVDYDEAKRREGTGRSTFADKDGMAEILRRSANFDAERNKLNGMVLNARDKILTGFGMAAQLRSDALGMVGRVGGVLADHKTKKLEGGITDTESYDRELRDAAARSDDHAKTIIGEMKKIPTLLEQILKAAGKDTRDMIARFG